MEPCTLNGNFLKEDVIEEFHSLIWTERYYGDSEVELSVPLTLGMIEKLQEGTFLCIDESDEPMIIETVSVEEGKIKVMGISILSWLNNRFIRTTANHTKQVWTIKNQTAGQVLWTVVREMCTEKSSYLRSPFKDMGLTQEQAKELAIPKLRLDDQEDTTKKLGEVAVPFGPVYEGLRKIAEQHHIGMQIKLMSDFTLGFRSYKGINRTGDIPDTVRFSVDMESFADIKELRSTAAFKTLVYAFAANLQKIDMNNDDTPDTWIQTTPGVSRLAKEEGKYPGFDLRAKMIFPSDINLKHDLEDEDDVDSSLPAVRKKLKNMLNDRADKELKLNKRIQTVDGTVSSSNLFQYGLHYNLGDIVEVEGLTGATEYSRVTEYIRAQDAEGERSYPTVEADEP